MKRVVFLILYLLSFDLCAEIVVSIENRIFIADKISVSRTTKRPIREKIEIQFGSIEGNIISYFKYEDYHNDIKIEEYNVKIIRRTDRIIEFQINDLYTICIEENRNTKPSFIYRVKNIHSYPRIRFVNKKNIYR